MEGAVEAVREMFEGLDTDKDGLVRTSSLARLTSSLGIDSDDLQAWMKELPAVLHRVPNQWVTGPRRPWQQ